METTILIIICLVILIIQLLLCFKVKKLVIKLIPACLFLVAFIISMILLLTATGWDALGYIAFVFLFAGTLIACVAGWVIWAVCHFIRKMIKTKQTEEK